MASGTLSTAIAMRTLCAAATRSVRAPQRSASNVIYGAPPTAPEKYIVALVSAADQP